MKTISRIPTGSIVRIRLEFPLGSVLPLVEGFKKSNDPGEYTYLRSQPR